MNRRKSREVSYGAARLMKRKGLHRISWDKVTASKNDGGLGIGSLKAHNIGLIMKWVWRLRTEKEALWCKVIVGLHNQVFDYTSRLGISDDDLFHIHTRSGNSMLWKDKWIDSISLQTRFPTLYSLESRKTCFVYERKASESLCWAWRSKITSIEALNELYELVFMLNNYNFLQGNDMFKCIINNDGGFTVEVVRKIIDLKLIATGGVNFMCNKITPLKVLCFVWRAVGGRILIVVELLRKRVQVPSISCHLCDSGMETADHVLINCRFAECVMEGILKWCNILFRYFTNIGELINSAASWADFPRKRKLIIV
ncbi:unnamed protein product [Lactuca saligna]|uniref:Reverse transcriptase zinc-binding domain-containing protein n=1 Tax=Lactuca saligna TaxID=75948 RepID=A0AA35Y8E4_LACSI|nr:unnamed protein product [Lactuca saligna]